MLQDVPSPLWIVTIAVVAVCAWLALVDVPRWRRRIPVQTTLKRLFLWGGAVCLTGWALEVGSTASNAPHAVVVGSVQRIEQQFYHGGREGMIGCVGDCRSMLLNFDPEATEAVMDNLPGTVLKVGYLDERKQISARTLGFDVVDIWDSETGQNLYHLDTELHLQRLVLLLMDAGLLLLAAVVCARMSGAEPDPEEETELEPVVAVTQFCRSEWPAIHPGTARESAEPAD